MALYLGKQTMGDGKTPLPVTANGQLDINSLMGMIVDQQKAYVWDTLRLAPGSTVAQQPYRLFQVPQGQQDPYNGGIVKTAFVTSMTKAGEFAPPTDFILNNLGFQFLTGDNMFDIEQIANSVYFEFTILKKVFFSGHLERHPPGMGFTGVTNVAGDHSILNGVAEPSKVWHFGDWKKYIPPSVSFGITLYFNETYDTLYNGLTGGGTGAAAANIPADITSKLITPGIITGANRATLQPASAGGNGIQLRVILNGISNGPVQ